VLADIPDRPPELPPGMVTVRIDSKTGQRARAGTPGAIFEVFRKGHEPGFAPAGGGLEGDSGGDAGGDPAQPTDLF